MKPRGLETASSSRHLRPLSPGDMASATEELNLLLYFIVMCPF